MSRDWLRYWNLTVSGAGGKIDLSNLRITFNIKQWTLQAPNIGSFRIYNLSKKTANMIEKEFTHVSFTAGYQDKNGLLFDGTVKQFRDGRENPTDTFLDIFAADGEKPYNYATVSKTLAAGSKPQDHFDVIMKAFQGMGLTKGFVAPFPNFKYPRGVVLFGMARDLMRTLAFNHGMMWSIQNSKVQVIPKTGSLPGGAIEMNSTTGMIGMPVQMISGIMVRCLVNVDIHPGSLIHINQADIQKAQLDLSQLGDPASSPSNMQIPDTTTDGIYLVVQIEKSGDSRGTPWYYDLTCIAKGTTGYVPPDLLGKMPFLQPSG